MPVSDTLLAPSLPSLGTAGETTGRSHIVHSKVEAVAFVSGKRRAASWSIVSGLT